MSNDDKYLSVRVVKEQPIPFNGEEVAPMFRGVILFAPEEYQD